MRVYRSFPPVAPKSALDYRQIVIGGAHVLPYFDAVDPLQGLGPGVITAGIGGLQIHFQGLTIMSGDSKPGPGTPSEYGTVVLNKKPTKVGVPIGWVQISPDPTKPDWRPFGTIQ